MSKSNNNIDTASNKKKSFVMSKSNNNIDTALSSFSETEGVNFGDDSNGGGSTSNMKGYRVETTDLQTAEYLLRLLLSHEQYGTQCPFDTRIYFQYCCVKCIRVKLFYQFYYNITILPIDSSTSVLLLLLF